MKLSFSVLPLVALASTMMQSSLVAATESIHQYTSLTLEGTEGAMQEGEVTFFQETFADAYNLVHKRGEGAQVDVTSLTLDAEVASRRALRGDEHRKLPGSWTGGWTGGNCNFCFRRDLNEQDERQANEPDMPGDNDELHRRFELTFAAILREGPYEYFHGVSDVSVDFGATPPAHV